MFDEIISEIMTLGSSIIIFICNYIFNKWFLPPVNVFTAYKAIQFLDNEYDHITDSFVVNTTASENYLTEDKVQLLQYMGFLNTSLYDLGDSPSCAKIIGIKPADLTFQQGTMKLKCNFSEKPAVLASKLTLLAKIYKVFGIVLRLFFPFLFQYYASNINVTMIEFVKNRPIDKDALWFNGKVNSIDNEFQVTKFSNNEYDDNNDDDDWSVDSVTSSFCGRVTLFLSTPAAWNKDSGYVWFPSILLSSPYKTRNYCILKPFEVAYPSSVRLITPLLQDNLNIDNKGYLRLTIHAYYILVLFIIYFFIALVDWSSNDTWFLIFQTVFIFELFDFLPRFFLSRGWLTIVGKEDVLGEIYKQCIFTYHIYFICLLFALILVLDPKELNDTINWIIFLSIYTYQTAYRRIYHCKGIFFGKYIKII